MCQWLNGAWVALALSIVVSAGHLHAAEPVFVEVRRTFASPECDSGEIHVDGVLVSLFQADPTTFGTPGVETLVVDGEVSAERHKDTVLYFSEMQSLALRDGTGQLQLRFVMLNGTGFSPFQRRERKRRLPRNELVLGYAVHNRLCEVTAAAPAYNDDDDRLSRTSNLMGAAVLGVPNLAAAFPSTEVRKTVLVFTDRSHRLEVDTQGFAYRAVLPGTSANAVGKGSPCLTKFEHMHNTIISNAGASYRRDDYVVACALGSIDGQAALEWRRDVRFMAFQELADCANLLGIPVSRTWYLTRGTADAPGASYRQCLGDEFVKQADGAAWLAD